VDAVALELAVEGFGVGCAMALSLAALVLRLGDRCATLEPAM